MRIEQAVAKHGPASVAVQLSPEMSCEEAWLLATYVRSLAPDAALAVGPVQVLGEDQRFPRGAAVREAVASPDAEKQSAAQPALEQGVRAPSGSLPVLNGAKFIIRAEKNPNCRGVEAVLAGLGGSIITHEDLLARAGKGEYKTLWIVGGYPNAAWASKELATAAAKAEFLVVQDIFENGLTAAAHLLLPFCAWVEREGSFMNHQGLLQPFGRVINPPEGAMSDGQYLWSIAGYTGLFRAEKVRELMAASLPEFPQLHVPPPAPEHQH